MAKRKKRGKGKRKGAKRKQTPAQAAASAKNLRKARKARKRKSRAPQSAAPKRKRKKGKRKSSGRQRFIKTRGQDTLDFMNREIDAHNASQAMKAYEKYYSQFEDSPPGKPSQLSLFGNPGRRRRRRSSNPIWLPKTARGRPARVSYWLLDVYSKGGAIKTYVARTDKRSAERQAMAKLVSLRADKVSLSGPYRNVPHVKSIRTGTGKV